MSESFPFTCGIHNLGVDSLSDITKYYMYVLSKVCKVATYIVAPRKLTSSRSDAPGLCLRPPCSPKLRVDIIWRLDYGASWLLKYMGI